MLKMISSHAHETGAWYLLRDFFKIFNEHSRPFDMGAPAREGAGEGVDQGARKTEILS